MNVTYLFELTKATNIPPSSEHFWTTLFNEYTGDRFFVEVKKMIK